MTDDVTDGMTDDDALDPVATTARLTAAERERESARPDRLFDDPFAGTLAGDAGRAMMRRFEGTAPGDNPVIAVRTHWFDDALTAAVADARPTAGGRPGSRAEEVERSATPEAESRNKGAGGRPGSRAEGPQRSGGREAESRSKGAPRQVVLVAAGMDSRAYRLPLPEGTVLFELDRPELLRLKASLLAGGPPPRLDRRAVEVDLTGDWPAALSAAGFDPRLPTCWLAEGLTQYLRRDDVEGLLDRVTALSAPGSRLLIDFVGRSLLEHPGSRPMLDLFAEHDMTWHFGTDDPESLLTPRGWRPDVATLGGYATALGRWPFPDAPRGTPGVPQGYVVDATR